MAWDQKKQNASARKHYLKNKQSIIAKNTLRKAEYRIRNRQHTDAFLRQHPCVDCGESDIVVLDFDHVRGHKKDDVSNLVTKAVSIKRLQEEIDKCEIRCANCHRRKTRLRSREAAISPPS